MLPQVPTETAPTPCAALGRIGRTTAPEAAL